MKPILILLAVMLLPGCTILGGKGFTPPELKEYSDNGVETYAKEYLGNWGTRASKAHMIDVGGNVVLSTAATAVAIASSSGAQPGTISLVGSIFSTIGQGLGLVDTPAIANAYSGGAGLIKDSQSVYGDCIANLNPKPAAKTMSNCGSAFLRGINDADHFVSRMLLGIPADSTVQARLLAVINKAQNDLMVEAVAKAAAQAAKLAAQPTPQNTGGSNATPNSVPGGAAAPAGG